MMDETSALNQVTQELYAALRDDAVERKWKKKAVNLLVEIDSLQRELGNKTKVPPAALKQNIRQAEDLLNQLNRY